MDRWPDDELTNALVETVTAGDAPVLGALALLARGHDDGSQRFSAWGGWFLRALSEKGIHWWPEEER